MPTSSSVVRRSEPSSIARSCDMRSSPGVDRRSSMSPAHVLVESRERGLDPDLHGGIARGAERQPDVGGPLDEHIAIAGGDPEHVGHHRRREVVRGLLHHLVHVAAVERRRDDVFGDLADAHPQLLDLSWCERPRHERAEARVLGRVLREHERLPPRPDRAGVEAHHREEVGGDERRVLQQRVDLGVPQHVEDAVGRHGDGRLLPDLPQRRVDVLPELRDVEVEHGQCLDGRGRHHLLPVTPVRDRASKVMRSARQLPGSRTYATRCGSTTQ